MRIIIDDEYLIIGPQIVIKKRIEYNQTQCEPIIFEENYEYLDKQYTTARNLGDYNGRSY